MNQSTVAERFNAASESLELRGHRVIVRRARLLLESGKADDAVSFLEDAGHRMRGLGVDGLAADLRAWRDAGGDPGALVTDPVWVRGAAADHMRARTITQLTHDASLQDMIDALADQRTAVAAGSPLAGPPSTLVALDKLPPLPRKTAGDKKSLGDVFSRPVVDPPVRPPMPELDLSDADPLDQHEDDALLVSVERTPPPAATSDDVLKLVSQPPEDFPVPTVRASSSQPAAQTAPDFDDEAIELTPAPDTPMDVSAPAPAAEPKKSPLLLMGLVVLVAVAGALYYFANQG